MSAAIEICCRRTRSPSASASRQPLLDLQSIRIAGRFCRIAQGLTDMEPADVHTLVKDSNLRGRGGAGFPTGVKWSLVPMGPDAPKQKYLVCNADEMEPGTFKDRLLMEQLPHQLIEAMIVAGYALQATHGYIFLRGEYVVANRALERAIEAGERRRLSRREHSRQRLDVRTASYIPAPAATSAAKKPR